MLRLAPVKMSVTDKHISEESSRNGNLGNE
jgi:hypothetical protein